MKNFIVLGFTYPRYICSKWIEKGEYSPDGKVWYPYVDMKLTKLD